MAATCTDCNRSFRSDKALTDHLNSDGHHRVLKNVANNSSVNEPATEKPVSTRKPNSLRCESCNRSFRDPITIKEHNQSLKHKQHLSELNCPMPEPEGSIEEPESDDMASTPATKATNKALNTPEILEKVLLHLPALSTFPSQRVNRFWMQLISTSPELQQNMFLRLPIPSRTSTTSTVEYEIVIWKETRTRDEDYTDEIVKMQRTYAAGKPNLEGCRYACVPVTINPLLRVVDRSVPLLERVNKMLTFGMYNSELEEHDMLMCEFPSSALSQPEASLWRMFFSSPACDSQALAIFLRFGDGKVASSSREYPVMVQMARYFNSDKGLKMRTILDMTSKRSFKEVLHTWVTVDPQRDIQSKSRLLRNGGRYNPWGLYPLSNSQSRDAGYVNYKPVCNFADSKSLDEILNDVKEEYGWLETSIAPLVREKVAFGKVRGMPIVVPDDQDRGQIHDSD